MLHDTSIYRIKIECTLNIYHQYLLQSTSVDIKNLHRIQMSARNQFDFSDLVLSFDGISENLWSVLRGSGSLFGKFALNRLFEVSDLKKQVSIKTQKYDIVQY